MECPGASITVGEGRLGRGAPTESWRLLYLKVAASICSLPPYVSHTSEAPDTDAALALQQASACQTSEERLCLRLAGQTRPGGHVFREHDGH